MSGVLVPQVAFTLVMAALVRTRFSSGGRVRMLETNSTSFCAFLQAGVAARGVWALVWRGRGAVRLAGRARRLGPGTFCRSRHQRWRGPGQSLPRFFGARSVCWFALQRTAHRCRCFGLLCWCSDALGLGLRTSQQRKWRFPSVGFFSWFSPVPRATFEPTCALTVCEAMARKKAAAVGSGLEPVLRCRGQRLPPGTRPAVYLAAMTAQARRGPALPVGWVL